MYYARTESDLFDTDLHRQWKADRARRLRVPLDEAWRGCLGLAMLLDRPDDTEAHDDLALVRNDQVRWLAHRDVPVGRCPGSPVMNRRDVNYANAAVAELRYGMPVIDFTRYVRDAVDFKFLPTTAYDRRFCRRRLTDYSVSVGTRCARNPRRSAAGPASGSATGSARPG